MTDVSPVPKKVRKLVADYTKIMGVTPEITHVDPLTWQLSITGEHVTATCLLKNVNGKTRWTEGTLIIDGETHNTPATPRALRSLWDKHELRITAELPPVPPAGGSIPAAIKQMHTQLSAHGVPVLVGYENGKWILGLETAGNGLRLTYIRTGSNWHVHDMQVVLAGVDRTGEFKDAADAIAAVLGTTPEQPAVGSRVGKSDSTRDVGVEMRKGNVIRV